MPNYKLYTLFVYVVYWILPTILIIVSYAVIIVTFKRSSLSLRRIASGSTQRSTLATLAPAYSAPEVGGNCAELGRETGALSEGGARVSERARRRLLRLTDSLRMRHERRVEPNSTGRRIQKCGAFRNQTSVASESSEMSATVTAAVAAVAVAGACGSGCWPQLLSCVSGSVSSSADDELRKPRGTKLSVRHHNSLRQAAGDSTGANARHTSAATKSRRLTARALLQFRLAKMSLYLIALWLVSWTPIASLAMLNSISRCSAASATQVFLASTMTKLGPAFDVFIYGISHPKLKSRFKQLIRAMLCLDACLGRSARAAAGWGLASANLGTIAAPAPDAEAFSHELGDARSSTCAAAAAGHERCCDDASQTPPHN